MKYEILLNSEWLLWNCVWLMFVFIQEFFLLFEVDLISMLFIEIEGSSKTPVFCCEYGVIYQLTEKQDVEVLFLFDDLLKRGNSNKIGGVP